MERRAAHPVLQLAVLLGPPRLSALHRGVFLPAPGRAFSTGVWPGGQPAPGGGP